MMPFDSCYKLYDDIYNNMMNDNDNTIDILMMAIMIMIIITINLC